MFLEMWALMTVSLMLGFGGYGYSIYFDLMLSVFPFGSLVFPLDISISYSNNFND